MSCTSVLPQALGKINRPLNAGNGGFAGVPRRQRGDGLAQRDPRVGCGSAGEPLRGVRWGAEHPALLGDTYDSHVTLPQAPKMVTELAHLLLVEGKETSASCAACPPRRS